MALAFLFARPSGGRATTRDERRQLGRNARQRPKLEWDRAAGRPSIFDHLRELDDKRDMTKCV